MLIGAHHLLEGGCDSGSIRTVLHSVFQHLCTQLGGVNTLMLTFAWFQAQLQDTTFWTVALLLTSSCIHDGNTDAAPS